MKRSLVGCAAVLLIGVSASAFAAESESAEVLSVCLNKDNPPFSLSKEGSVGGFDYAVASAVATALGKKLDVKWYEKERRSRGPVSVKTSVLINGGICQLVGGYPLIQSSLDRPNGESTTLPPVDGLSAESRTQRIDGSQLLASSPYYFAGFTVVLGPTVPVQKLSSLDELVPYKIGGRPAGMGDLIAMAYKKGLLSKNAVHTAVQIEPLDALAKSEFDVTLVESHKFDIYRQENPAAPLRPSGLYLPVGLNLGFVSTAKHSALLAAVSGAVDALLKSGEIENIARKSGLTFITPQIPPVRSGLGLDQLIR